MPTALAQITPHPLTAPPTPVLSNREKAAIIVRMLLADGSSLPLADLPEHLQAALTEQMAAMQLVDRDTMAAVAEEFADHLEAVGIAFPGGIDQTLALLDGHISTTAASRLRRLAGASGKIDPWERITPLGDEHILPLLQSEAVEIAAILLAKLPVGRAAELLERLPGERARRIAHAVALTADIDPDTVRRIGLALMTQLETQPPRAFDAVPAERVGAILNVATPTVRDTVLDGLAADDHDFAEQVRRTIFTWEQIPARLAPRDVPRVINGVEQRVTIAALADSTSGDPVAEFILDNLGQRLAQLLRDEIAVRPRPRDRDITAARMSIVGWIRREEGAGELRLLVPEEDG